MLVRFKACAKCQGDLLPDEEDWKCLQCGARYYSEPPVNDEPPDPPVPPENDGDSKPVSVRRSSGGRYGNFLPRSAKINSLIDNRTRSVQEWIERHQEEIRYFFDGLSNQEIAEILAKDTRQVKRDRERFDDLYANGEI